MREVAAFAAQDVQLFLGFDAFGDGFQTELFREGDDGADQPFIVFIRTDPADEGVIDLEAMKSETTETAERAV